MVVCLERGADLHMVQLMPLPLIVSCFSKIQLGFTFLVPAHPGSPGKRTVKRVCPCVCVCVYGSACTYIQGGHLVVDMDDSVVHDACLVGVLATHRTRLATSETLERLQAVLSRRATPQQTHSRSEALLPQNSIQSLCCQHLRLLNLGQKSTGIDMERYVTVILHRVTVTSQSLWSRHDRHFVGIT